jgi:hypothetical protein
MAKKGVKRKSDKKNVDDKEIKHGEAPASKSADEQLDALFSDIQGIKKTKKEIEVENKKKEDAIAARSAAIAEASSSFDPAIGVGMMNGRTSATKQIAYGLIKSENVTVIGQPEAPLERIQDGVPVYKAHLLKVGDGGGTPDCPFDCNCCF